MTVAWLDGCHAELLEKRASGRSLRRSLIGGCEVRIAIVAGLGLVVAGCGPANEAKEAVSREMRDPSSVQFRDVKTVKQADGSSAVCGQYNAKNAFGAYVGFEEFSYHDGRVYLQRSNPDLTSADEIAQATEGLRAYTRLCTLKGRTIEEVQADTARILEEVEAMKRRGG